MLAVLAIKAPSLFHIGPPLPAAQAQPPAPPSASTSANEAAGPKKWSFLNDTDLKSLVARLRAEGFPPSIIRAIISSRINDLMSARRGDLAMQNGLGPYWSKKYGEFDPKTMEGFRALNKERLKMMTDLLGHDGDPVDFFGNDFRQKMNGGLPQEKYKRLMKISSDYTDLRNEVFQSSKGTLMPEDYEKLAYLDKEQQADVADSMTPDELFEYQIRNSNTANALRDKLQVFNPTEDEFLAIFKVQQAFDQQYGAPDGPLTPDKMRERQGHQGEILTQLQDILSPDRLAEYKQQTDPKFLAVNQVMARFDLPTTATRQIMDVENDITKRADALRSDKTLTEAERTSQLSALADEAKTKATAITGDRGFEAYKQSAGAWIQNLNLPAN